MNNIDIKKYKRFFAFGCSFTRYEWITWADIIAYHIKESYNYGRSGGGNSYIFYSLVEANKKHKFTKDDLVMVMWTNTAREDRYVNGEWLTPGNIYTQDFYPKSFIKEFSCTRGYFLRDMLNIESAKIILNSTECDWDFLSMVPIEKMSSQYEVGLENSQDIIAAFKDNLNIIKPSVYEILYNFHWQSRLNELFDDDKWGWGEHNYKNPHPTPLMHMEYLMSIYNLHFDEVYCDKIKRITDKIKQDKKNIELYHHYEHNNINVVRL